MSSLIVPVGGRLYDDSNTTSIFSSTFRVRVVLESPGTTCAFFDRIQGPDSVVGRIATAPIFGSWDHGSDASTSAPNTDNVDAYHSFLWWGVYNGYLQLRLFDGRPVTGIHTGSGTDLTVTAPTAIPIGVCTHCALTCNWPNTGAGTTGTYSLFVNGVQVATGTTQPTTGSGTGSFFLDFTSLAIGSSKDGYRPVNHRLRLMNWSTGSAMTAPQILAESQAPCSGTGLLNGAGDYGAAGLAEDAGTFTSGTGCCATTTPFSTNAIHVNAAQAKCDAVPQESGIPQDSGRCGPTVGGGHQYNVEDGLGDVPQHADPPEGEDLTNKSGIEPWIELVHTDYPSDVVTTYRRAFVELADDASYEGGRKPDGVLEIGRIENALGTEQESFEAATADIALSDQRDRLIRGLADDQDIDGDEVRIKLASDEGREAGTEPRVLMRGVVQRTSLESFSKSTLTVVDQLFSDFGPFGPDRKHPRWTFADIASCFPDMPEDVKAVPIPILYGEKSDEGAVDPITNEPRSYGVLPLYFCGYLDVTTLPAPPDATGRSLREVIEDLEAAIAGGATASDLNDDFNIGVADGQRIIDEGVGQTYQRLASQIGYADLDALLAQGSTPVANPNQYAFLCAGLGPWFDYTGFYGSDENSDPEQAPERVRIYPDQRNDIKAPGINWPYANPYLAVTNDDGRTFWLTGLLVHRDSQLLADHLKNVATIAVNAIGTTENGDGTGDPIMRTEDIKQHCLENHWFGEWSSGDYATTSTFPQWEDGTAKVRTSSFLARQNFYKAALGSEGLLWDWYENEQKPTLDIVRFWNRSSECRLGVNRHGQIIDFGIDETQDPTAWTRIDHVADVFGTVEQVTSGERENVVGGSCDWDPLWGRFRVGPVTFTSDDGIQKYKGRRKQGDPIDSNMLGIRSQLEWILQRRLARLQFDTKLLPEVSVPLNSDPGSNCDVGDGVLFNSEDGPGDGYVDHPFIVLRRTVDLKTRLVTFTLWDVREVLAETAFENGLQQLFVLDDEGASPRVLGDEQADPMTALILQ